MARKACTIAAVNQKGGSGKTTLIGNLAGEFNAMGFSVAVVDTDSQKSLTKWAHRHERYLASVTHTVTADPDSEVKARREFPLKAFVDTVTTLQTDVDYILIDTPPTQTSTAGLAAGAMADLILVPVAPSILDIEASTDAVRMALEAVKGDKKRVALVPYMTDSRTVASKDLLTILQNTGIAVLPAIRRLSGTPQTAITAQTLAEYAPRSPGRQEFSALAAAINRITKRR